jgi:hypothetical protein
MSLCSICALSKINSAYLKAIQERVTEARDLESIRHAILIPGTNFILGSLAHLRENASCPVCRLISNAVALKFPDRGPESWATAENLNGFFLYSKHPGPGFEIQINLCTADDSFTALIHHILAGGTLATGPSNGPHLDYIRLNIIDATWWSSPTGHARWHRAKGTQINRSLLCRYWLECQNYHPSCRPLIWSYQTFPFRLRVVDVESHRIVFAPPACRYAALSYRWSPSQADQLIIDDSQFTDPNPDAVRLSNGAYFNLDLQHVPATIFDAMELLTTLGGQFLWVDALCVAQSDVQERVDMIRNMDVIYRNAALTIIAAGSMDSGSPLPGFRPGSRRAVRLEEDVDGVTIRFSSSSLEEAVEQSEWNQRAWTYQERYFSIRQLIFTRDSVYYKCNQTVQTEDIIPVVVSETVAESQAQVQKLWSTPPEEVVRNLDESIPFEIPKVDMHYISSDEQNITYEIARAYCTHVTRYTARQLTFPDDIENALAGIMRQFAANYGVEFYWTFPSRGFHIALTWEEKRAHRSEGFGQVKQYFPRRRLHAVEPVGSRISNPRTDAILCPASTIPANNTIIQSNHPFPTWSWTGWVGPVVYSIDTLYGQLECDIVWPWEQPETSTREAYLIVLEQGILRFETQVACIPHARLVYESTEEAALAMQTDAALAKSRLCVLIAERTDLSSNRHLAVLGVTEAEEDEHIILYRESLHFIGRDIWAAANPEIRVVNLR